MTRRSGLGKGLGALIPPTEAPAIEESALREVAIDSITPNTYQPRKHLDEKELAPLAASIAEVGVLQPLLVREREGGGEFELIAGERRWRAARQAGLEEVPVIVRKSDDNVSLEEALVENLHRKDLNAVDEAAAYQQLIDDFKMTHESIGKRVGKSRTAISNLLRLLSLPPKVQRLLIDGHLSEGHGRALLGTTDKAFQGQLAERAARDQWSVRAVEEAIKDRHSKEIDLTDRSPVRTTKKQDAPALEWQERLTEFLDTKVTVSGGAKKGKVTIEFGGVEDLERISKLITAAPKRAKASR